MKDPRMIFGFALLFCLFILALVIGIGHVEQHTSYGLPIVLGSLSTMSGAFAGWCFSNKGKDEQK